MKKPVLLLLALWAAISLTGCDDKIDSVVKWITPTFNIELPDDLQESTVVNEAYTITNITKATSATYNTAGEIILTAGLYDVSYEATVTDSHGLERHVIAYRPSVTIGDTPSAISLVAFESLVNQDFIIEEVFFTGTLQSSGNQYYGDDYIKIYNNTDRVLYADGLSIVESKFNTTQKYTYTPDIMADAMTVQAIYTIPGSGRDHPVPPGGSLLLVDTGIDHRTSNPNSFDLSGADFEWYDVSSQPAHLDIDSPTVPNLDKWYCYTQSYFMLHNRGFKAWALARIPISKEEYLEKYWYDYDYTIVSTAGTFPMSQSAYRLPNQWIVDAVNCSVASERAWNVTDASLDRGWSHCGTIDKDKTRYFHSVRRKMLYLKNGQPVFKDTNNSTEDFNADVIAGLIEANGSAIDANGTRCTSLTWDGVTPRNDAAR